MKINPVNTSGINPYQQQTKRDVQQTASSTRKTDKVEISSEAKQLQKTSQFEQERSRKIEALKQQVQHGTYQPDAEKTAEGILKYFTGK
ncbi:flagellar biosynthesis anti-sigma factor FlgM [Heyndrickxia coagulans]|uniref:Negative regulator of flagellin synthesis n=1 Tax=Heyndrickxia coagulans TaxID=1398 RepID=A0A150K7J0_HEYCO|nr:flagellar biosynthesis anti-sigma factor FlgM [Heyndrickxia coagulans]KYC64874.1 hypothetical protein B4098_0548 [Heyndrickxia coagulans]